MLNAVIRMPAPKTINGRPKGAPAASTINPRAKARGAIVGLGISTVTWSAGTFGDGTASRPFDMEVTL